MRHYFELRLKELLQGLNFLSKQSREFPAGHNLLSLWKKFIDRYVEQNQQLSEDMLKSMDSLINEINAIDPKAMTFRFPVDLAGNKTLHLKKINLRNLRETFVRVCFLFDGVAMQIEDYVENTEDMIQELYSDFY